MWPLLLSLAGCGAGALVVEATDTAAPLQDGPGLPGVWDGTRFDYAGSSELLPAVVSTDAGDFTTGLRLEVEVDLTGSFTLISLLSGPEGEEDRSITTPLQASATLPGRWRLQTEVFGRAGVLDCVLTAAAPADTLDCAGDTDGIPLAFLATRR